MIKPFILKAVFTIAASCIFVATIINYKVDPKVLKNWINNSEVVYNDTEEVDSDENEFPDELKTVKDFTTNPGKFLVISTAANQTSKSPPVLLKAGAGLGNQLFGLACVYSIAKRRNSDVYIFEPDVRVYSEKHGHPAGGRPYALNHFNIPFARHSNDTLEQYQNGSIFQFKEQHIWEKSLPPDKVIRLVDLCGSEYYFKEFREEIYDMFQLRIDETPIKDILENIDTSQSASVHVRRGDYTRSDNRTMPISFQIKAMKWMKKLVPKVKFFVFSDDIKYCKEEFKGIPDITFVENGRQLESSLLDFLLMSRCKYNIIANSTFSWWAAYLNKYEDKIVIAPLPRHRPGWNEAKYRDKKMFKYRELVLNNYLYPTDWLTFNPFEY